MDRCALLGATRSKDRAARIFAVRLTIPEPTTNALGVKTPDPGCVGRLVELVRLEAVSKPDLVVAAFAERLGISRMTLRSKLRSLGMIQDRASEPDAAS